MTETTEAALRDMARAIGALESTVKTLTHQWRDQDEKASLGRRDLHQKIDGVLKELRTLDGLVKAAISDIAFMKPIVDSVEAAKLQAQGAVKAGRWIYVVLSGGGGMTLLWIVSHFVTVTLK
ncbi:hypothetical protein BDS110ZK18_66720 [Bradyrhizobium diazoefficiens]|uniref:DUF1515 domain-containing protein n=1 Tax=Bradyrhizobium diazoefficiens TaxID=1355477 RepID=A0A809Y0P3_9BRAD|nr:hypothetical protein XF2B_53100 [Bradyrhizobium diazoefficiens]BCF18615.1 hypothetical protein XF13B_53060 [Bradyrhizobium diazoefficiens]